MATLAPDTNIFVKSFFGKDEKEKMQYTFIILKDCKDKPSVIILSVKKEFYRIVDTLHTIFESIILGLNSGKGLDKTIQEIKAETNLVDIKKIKEGLPILGFDTKDIEKDKQKRDEFARKITKKLNEARSDFAVESNTYFLQDKQRPETINPIIQGLQSKFEAINQKFGANNNGDNVLHKEDEEHWIRTALFDKSNKMIFLTADYFGTGKDSQKAAEIKQDVENTINSELDTQFEIEFR